MTPLPSALRPASLACDGCRRRHLRCNGRSPHSPACPRCLSDGLNCTYTPSRRGLGRKAKRDIRTESVQRNGAPTPPTSTFASDASPDLFHLAAPAHDLALPSDHHEFESLATVATPFTATSAVTASPTGAPFTVDRQQLIDAFYTRFHAAHPLLVPRRFYAAQQYPGYLDLVVCL